jgi:hypothetical protein
VVRHGQGPQRVGSAAMKKPLERDCKRHNAFPVGPCVGGKDSCCFDILLIPLWFDYDSDRVFGHHEVPMLQVFRSFDGSEILIIAAASILVASITFLL